MTPHSEARRRLEAADRLLRKQVIDGVWPRACTWLLRLAVERALDALWARRCPDAANASRRAQLLALDRFVDAELARDITALWYTLSSAAHHHAYELAPVAVELRRWHCEAAAVIGKLERLPPLTSASDQRSRRTPPTRSPVLAGSVATTGRRPCPRPGSVPAARTTHKIDILCHAGQHFSWCCTAC